MRIELALDKRLRRVYSFHPTQLGFQKGKGTELALLRTKADMRNELLCMAVLDLEGAYESVPRSILTKRLYCSEYTDSSLGDRVEAASSERESRMYCVLPSSAPEDL